MQNDRFDAIPIPKELNNIVKAGVQEGIREQKRLHKNRLMLRSSATAAAALVAVLAGVLLISNPSVAAKLPLIGRIFTMMQDKTSYKGDFSRNAEVYVEEGGAEGTPERKQAEGIRREDMTQTSDQDMSGLSGEKTQSQYVQTANGLTVTISEANCTKQALYLALCIENEEEFPADFIKTKNMDDYILDYDMLYLTTKSYYNIPSMGKEERNEAAGNGFSVPAYIEGNFVDSRTFTGIIMVSLEDDLMCGGQATTWPEQFTYYLEISDIYGELLEYEEIEVRDPETGEMITISESVMKHYTGTWNFAIEVNTNRTAVQTVQVNKTNEDGVGIASVEKPAFEISAQIILPEDVQRYDYVVTILDADKKRLENQGANGDIFSIYGRNTDTVYVYVCDYMQFMDELKGDDKKIEEGALFGTEVHF